MRELLRECLIRGMFMKYGSKLTYGAHAEGVSNRETFKRKDMAELRASATFLKQLIGEDNIPKYSRSWPKLSMHFIWNGCFQLE